jgi:hypothetical protein
MFLLFGTGEPIGWCKYAPKGCLLSFLKGWMFDFPSSPQTVTIEFLSFPSKSHQNPFVLIKFSNNSHQIPLVPINNPSISFCSHQVPKEFP